MHFTPGAMYLILANCTIYANGQICTMFEAVRLGRFTLQWEGKVAMLENMKRSKVGIALALLHLVSRSLERRSFLSDLKFSGVRTSNLHICPVHY